LHLAEALGIVCTLAHIDQAHRSRRHFSTAYIGIVETASVPPNVIKQD
jgi:hypothetical protein